MSRVYWDSMLFIYLLEAHPIFGPGVRKLLQYTVNRNDTLSTSVFTVGEVLTGPRRRGSTSGTAAVERYFQGGAVEVLPFTHATAARYSVIRSAHRVSQADAIHLATAAEAGIDLFLTNDAQLRKLIIPGIKFFADLDGKII